MIRHAPKAAAFPVGSLAVAVIEPSFPALLVFPAGGSQLLLPRFLSASVAAVDLPPIAGTADVKHRPQPGPRQNNCRHSTLLAMPRTIP